MNAKDNNGRTGLIWMQKIIMEELDLYSKSEMRLFDSIFRHCGKLRSFDTKFWSWMSIEQCSDARFWSVRPRKLVSFQFMLKVSDVRGLVVQLRRSCWALKIQAQRSELDKETDKVKCAVCSALSLIQFSAALDIMEPLASGLFLVVVELLDERSTMTSV